MYQAVMSEAEIASVEALVRDIAAQYSSVEDPAFLRVVSPLAHELPVRLRQFLYDFRLAEQSGVCLVSGFPVDDGKIGATPAGWAVKPAISPTLTQEIFFVLCASLLGEIFGWSTQQDGHLMHEVMPMKEHEDEQIGTGSAQRLWWHTEDAFHPFRADYVGLMCLRNPDDVETTVAKADDIPWADLDLDLLFGPNYWVRPDESHLPKNRAATHDVDQVTARLLEAAYDRIMTMNDSPEKRPVLFGDRAAPYLRLDPYFMDMDELNAAERQALEGLVRAIDGCLQALVLRPGDCCFIDNFRTVHGRNSFQARFDGTDRWLKRLNITRDLRSSREARSSSASRVIF